MIKIDYGGRLGNIMFSNAYGYILSKKLKCNLDSQYIKGFENTKISDNLYKTENILTENNFHYKNDAYTSIYDLFKDKKKNYKIILNGPFMNYKLYIEHLNELREYFKLEVPLKIIPEKNDLVIHIRSGDIWYKETMKKYDLDIGHHSKEYLKKQLQVALPITFFCNIIDNNNFDKIIVVSEYKDDLICQKIKEIYSRTIIISESINHDFHLITKANNIIMSNSTFSWWSSFLSKAEKIYYPEIGYFKDNIKPYCDLNIPNDNRYIKIKLNTRYDTFNTNWNGDDKDLEKCLNLYNKQINFFILWGHSYNNIENILKMMNNNDYYDIIKIIKMPINNYNLAKFIYKKDGLEKEHIINKLNYLKNNDYNSPFLIIIKYDKEFFYKIKNYKWKIREKYNPKDNNCNSSPLPKGVSHHHVIHLSDEQNDFIILQKEYPNLIKNIDYYLNFSPKNMFSQHKYIIKKVKIDDLRCSIIGVENKIKIEDTPHYEYLLNKKEKYNKYILDNIGSGIKDYHLSDKYDKLINDFKYGINIDNFNTYIFCRNNIILDGLHRACIYKFKNIDSYINIYSIEN